MQKIKYYTVLIIVLVFSSCGKSDKNDISKKPLCNETVNINNQSSDTLKVGIIYGSTSYFYFKDELMGYDYEMALNLAQFLKKNIKFCEVRTESQLAKLLETNQIDLVAYNIFETKKLKSQFNFVFPQKRTFLVLVQNIGISSISDVTDLNGRTVYVKKNTIYQQRLEALNNEIGGKIDIKYVDDTTSTEDLLENIRMDD